MEYMVGRTVDKEGDKEVRVLLGFLMMFGTLYLIEIITNLIGICLERGNK